MITITSKHNNFRRCGAAHPATPASYPDDHWSPEQLAILQAEPQLTVVISEDQGGNDDTDPATMTVKELTTQLAALLIEIPKGAKKDELLALYQAATQE